MGKMLDVVEGQRFNRWTIIKEVPAKNGNRRVICQCDCGTIREQYLCNIKDGKHISCGCYHSELMSKIKRKHGGCKTDIYNIYSKIKERCYNTNCKIFYNYGGRGIKMCDRWFDLDNGFECFREDMGERPSLKYSVDRIYNDGDYSPDNCRWATCKEQCRNTRSNHVITYNEMTKCLTEWSEVLGINYKTLHNRLVVAKWSVEKAFTHPIRGK